MIRVVEINMVTPYSIECTFNNGISKKLDIYPLIENHKNLRGIEKLLETQIFNKVRIGEMGELVWDSIIQSVYNGETTLLDYDISPEFAYSHSIY